MAITRRDAIRISGSTLAGLSLVGVKPEELGAQASQAAAPAWPDRLVETPMREGFPAPLPLNPDGSAPEHPASAGGPISDPLMWRTPGRQTPDGEADYRERAIKVDTRRLARLSGTLRFADLEALPRVTQTFLLQCGAPNPRGIVTWTGVRFSDVADMLGLLPTVHYGRLVATDGHYVDEPMTTLRHPQVMLAWLMNGAPIPLRHGAPLRLIVPFRYGNRSIKAITEMVFATPSLPMPPLPA